MLPYTVMMISTLLFSALWQYTNTENIILYQFKAYKIQANKKLLFMFAAFLPMYLINSFMSFVGNDYKNYFNIYANVKNGSLISKDFSYFLINKVLALLGLDFQFVYIFCCLIGYGLLIICIRDYSANYAVSYLLYFCCGFFYLLGLNQLRQFVALVIVFYAYRYIAKDNKFVKYAILVLLATSFHFSAIIMLPAYFLLKLRMKASYLAVLSLFLLPFNFFYSQVLKFLFTTFKPGYVGTAFMDKTFYLYMPLILGSLLIAFIILIYYNQLIKSGVQNMIFVNGAFFSTIIYILCGWVPEYYRFAYYFQIPIIFLIPNIVKLERNMFFRVLLISVVCGYYFIVYTYRSSTGWGVLPYKSIFD